MDVEGLARAAEEELSARGILRSGGRVSERLTARTVRYYTSLGLVDRPLGYQGGRARYGARHLLQLLAVRALQADFMPLPEIQKRLYGRSDRELEEIVEAATPARRDGKAPAPRPPVRRLPECSPLPGLRMALEDARSVRDWLRQHGEEEFPRRVREALQALLEAQQEEEAR